MKNLQSRFVPKEYLRRINLVELLPKNHLYSENNIVAIRGACFICNSLSFQGLILSNKKKVCSVCFEKMRLIEYPEKYEKIKREFIVNEHAWKLAYNEFKIQNEKKDISAGLIATSVISLILLQFAWQFVFLSVLLFVLSRHNASSVLKKESDWKSENPYPVRPILRGFHESSSEFSDYDKKVVHVFLFWPGYPPFWDYLRKVVLERDGHKCQVTGCPSRSALHVHHKIAISNGGQHHRNNLVTLCEFHHGIQPDDGHERIFGRVKNQYFTLVPSHLRRNRASSGKHQVKAHLRRLKLVTLDEIRSFNYEYGVSCYRCGSLALTFSIFNSDQQIRLLCKKCHVYHHFERLLSEETCPLICLKFKPTKSNRSLQMDPKWMKRYTTRGQKHKLWSKGAPLKKTWRR